jgi:DNA-binding response OmpR family regulator
VTASILMIDDDAAIIAELKTAFLREGYPADHVVPGAEALWRLTYEEPDLIILGCECRESDWGFCHWLLRVLDRPLLLLLNTKDKHDRIKGLEMGADDCMIKPVIAEEVVARTRALLRRDALQLQRLERTLSVDEGFRIDLACREVWLDDQLVLLTPTEFRLLCCLARHAGEVVSPERLALHVWGPEVKDGRDMVKVYVHRLRRKLELDARQPQRLLTRRGAGYVLRASRES